METRPTQRSLPLVSSAPGKVILFGEHAVVHGKLALASSLGLRVYALFEKTNVEKEIVLELLDVKLRCRWTKEQLQSIYQHEFLQSLDVQKPNSSPDFLDKLKTLINDEKILQSAEGRGVLVFLFLYFVATSSQQAKEKTFGLKVSVKSFLPIGMGLGSSGSFSVCIANGLFAAYNIHANDYQQSNFVWEPSKAQKELVNGWAFQAEKIAHGNPSGIDNSVSTYGGTLTLRRLPDRTDITPLDKTPSLSFLLTNTKVPRNTSQLVGRVGEFVKSNPSEAIPMLNEIDEISKSCVQKFSENIQRKQLIEDIGALMGRNHELLNKLGVGHKALERVCETTKKFGLHSKLTGAGGGGCALTLLKDSMKTSDIAEVIEALEAESPEFGRFECFIAEIGGKGVLLHDPSEISFKFEEETSQYEKIKNISSKSEWKITPWTWGFAAVSIAAIAAGMWFRKRHH